MTSHRPSILTWISAFQIILGATGFIRFFSALDPTPVKTALPAWYIPVTGLLWGTAFLSAAVLIWIPRPWVPKAVRIQTIACILWLWADRLFLTRSEFASQSILSTIVISGLLYLLLLFILNTRRVAQFFSHQ